MGRGPWATAAHWQADTPALRVCVAPALPASPLVAGAWRRYLWSNIAGIHGKAGALRREIKAECLKSKRCHPPFNPKQESPEREHDFNHEALIDLLTDSTFCAQTPGDTISRKGLVDSIVMGCIPIVFITQQRYGTGTAAVS